MYRVVGAWSTLSEDMLEADMIAIFEAFGQIHEKGSKDTDHVQVMGLV